MLWGDVELSQTAGGREFLQFTERATKTRNGATTDPRALCPKQFSQPGDPYCPVATYKKYADLRPLHARQPDSRFYLQINPFFGHPGKRGESWFDASGMGKNTIGTIAKRMSENAGFNARHVNHSGRKTFITSLLDANVPPSEVAQISGHRNIMSLNHYNTVSLDKQIHMSTIIHNGGANATVSRAPVSSGDNATNDFNQEEITDEELIQASQDIEQTLNTIDKYENIHCEQVVDLPLRQSPGGSLQVASTFRPEALFNNCVFHQSVAIHLK